MFVYNGPERYRALCTFLQHPYKDENGFGLWGALRQKDREFAGWDADSITGMLVLRAGLWGDANSILSVVERFAPVYNGSLTLRELHRARLGESTLGRVHLKGGAWKGSRPRLKERSAYSGPEGSYLSAQLDLPDRGPTGVILNNCGCRSCEEEGVWDLFDLFDPAGGEPDLWQPGRPYTPVGLDSPRDLGVVEAATYLWAEELAR